MNKAKPYSARATLMLALVLVVFAPNAVHAIAFNNLYFFGDSLTDSGSPITGFAPSPPYSGSSFSNGPVWAEVAGAAYGLPVTWGINNFAVAGARSGDLTGVVSPTQSLLGISQTAHFLSTVGGAADPNSLYSIWMGGNDLREFLSLPPAMQDPVAFMTGLFGNIGSGVGALAAAGARQFVLTGLPDLSFSPEVPDPAKSAVSGFIQIINANLDLFAGNLAGLLGVDVYTFNVIDALAPHLDGWLDTNGNLGLSVGESALPCLAVPTCFAAAPGGDTSPFLLFDTLHPTREVHAIIGASFARAVPEPSVLVLFGIALVSAVGWQRRSQI
jgi:cholinesterase